MDPLDPCQSVVYLVLDLSQVVHLEHLDHFVQAVQAVLEATGFVTVGSVAAGSVLQLILTVRLAEFESVVELFCFDSVHLWLLRKGDHQFRRGLYHLLRHQ